MTRKKIVFIVCLLLLIPLACSPRSGGEEQAETSKMENKELNKTMDPKEQVNAQEEAKENAESPKTEETLDIVFDRDDSITVLVNKQHSLAETYAPTDLVPIEVPKVLDNPEINQLREVAAEALKEMFEAASAEGHTLYARSGYRSHQTQALLFENYSNKHGEEAANRYSARPGQSEHQTGLVMDVTSESVDFQLVEGFRDVPEGQWVAENAHRFGFIVRYPEGKEEITGYIYEPWHLRYLGKDVAEAIYKSGLTYEEFLVEKGFIHAVNQ